MINAQPNTSLFKTISGETYILKKINAEKKRSSGLYVVRSYVYTHATRNHQNEHMIKDLSSHIRLLGQAGQ